MRRLIPFILGILVLLIVVCAPFLLRLDKYRNQIADHLTQQLNHKVIIGRLDVGIFPPVLKLQDVGMMNPAGDTALLQVEQLIVSINVPALFRAAIVPQNLKFRGWLAYVRRNPDGTWAWDEWVSPAVQIREKTGWPIKSIALERGECHAVDPYGPGPGEFIVQILQGGWENTRQYLSLNGVLTTLPAPVHFLFQGSGRFFSNPEWSAVLELTDENRRGKLEWKVAQGRAQDGKGESDEWRFDTLYGLVRYYARLPAPAPIAAPGALLKGWRSRFEWQGSTLTFTQNASVGGGEMEATGAILFQPAVSLLRMDVGFKEVKAQGIEAALWGRSSLEGTATGLAHFEMALTSAPWASIQGRGALEMTDGHYYWPDASLQSLSKAHTLRYLQKKYPNFAQNGLPYKKLGVHWQARRGLVSFNDAIINLGDVQVAMVGSYDIARRGIDAYTRVQIHEPRLDLIKELPSTYIYRGNGRTSIQPMHGSLQGTPAEWRLRAIRPSKISSAILNKLSKSIRQR